MRAIERLKTRIGQPFLDADQGGNGRAATIAFGFSDSLTISAHAIQTIPAPAPASVTKSSQRDDFHLKLIGRAICNPKPFHIWLNSFHARL